MADAGSSSLHRAHKAKAHKNHRRAKRRPELVIKQPPQQVMEAAPAPAPPPQQVANVVPPAPTPTPAPVATRAATSLLLATHGFPTLAVLGGFGAAGGLTAIILSNRNRSSARPASP
jgi:hypothetical protein